jgi:lysozyme family protein
MATSAQRQAMGFAIVRDFEGRYKHGKLQCYQLPPGDGGGAYEIAGINERYHGTKAAQLKALVEAGEHAKAEQEAATYIIDYTKAVLKFFPSTEAAEANPQIEFLLRDTAFNRGAKGAATVLQLALGMADIDGAVGPATHREFAKQLEDPGPEILAHRITQARETYEKTSYPWKTGRRDERSRFWKGLSNRWAKAHAIATSDRFV